MTMLSSTLSCQIGSRFAHRLGPYNPDWALLYEEDDEQHLYFIVETKGDTSFEQLRPHERAKILAGEKHFKAVDTDIKFKRVSDEAEIRG